MEVTPRLHSHFVLAIFTGMVAVCQSERWPFSSGIRTQYRALDFNKMRTPIFINLRNVYKFATKKSQGLGYDYVGNGRGCVLQ